MIGVCFLISCIAITVEIIIMTIDINNLSKEIDEIKEKLEQHRIRLQDLDFYALSDHERRLDQLEEALELKEYFDKEQLNEEEK